MNTLMRKKRRVSDLVLLGLIYLSAAFALALLIGIIVYVFAKGAHTISWTFLTTVTSSLKGTVGILGNIVNTLYIIVLTLLIATPIGYLSE